MGLKRVNWHALKQRVDVAMLVKGIEGLKSTLAATAQKPAINVNEALREKLERKLDSYHN
jgi:hypothetical protein